MIPWTATHQASLSFSIFQSLLKLMSIESVMPSNHIIFCCSALLLPSIIPSIRIFSIELALCIWGTNYWSFSFSISPQMNIQSWFPFRLTALITLLSKGLSRIFSSTTIQKHQIFSIQLFLRSNSHIHAWLQEKTNKQTNKKNIALTIQTFVSKEMSLLFNALFRFVRG